MLLTRSPLSFRASSLHFARLACVRHAASVRPEPGSNSPIKVRCAHFVLLTIVCCQLLLTLTLDMILVQFSKNIRFLSPKRQLINIPRMFLYFNSKILTLFKYVILKRQNLINYLFNLRLKDRISL